MYRIKPSILAVASRARPMSAPWVACNHNDRKACESLLQTRAFAVTGRHSQIVAGKKNKLDAMKTKLYQRLSIKILMAAKAGGTDVSTNKDLARALKEAHAAKLPKDNVDRALKKASESTAEEFKVGVYEIFGYGGVGLLAVTLTDNATRAFKWIKAAVNKYEGAKMASAGSVLFSFTHKGVLRISASYSEDSVIEAALISGVDDVEFQVLPTANDEDADQQVSVPAVIVEPDQLNLMLDALTNQALDATGNLEYLPTAMATVNAEEKLKNMDLIESLMELDDVDKVYHNMETPDK